MSFAVFRLLMLRHHPAEEFEEPALGIVGDKLLKPVFDLMAAAILLNPSSCLQSQQWVVSG
jgi:hypothetical protein